MVVVDEPSRGEYQWIFLIGKFRGRSVMKWYKFSSTSLGGKYILMNEYIPMMIIFTDGIPNVGFNKKFSSLSNRYLHDMGFPIELDNSPVEDAIKIAENLKDKEISTVVVNFGKEELGHEFNMDLSKASGGRYYDLQDLITPETVVTKILDYERPQF